MPSRLDKLLVARGVCSRKDARRLCKRGQVTVDGAVVKDFSAKVDEAADLRLDGVPVLPLPLLYKWHKPEGVLTSMGDPMGRLSLAEAGPELPPGYHPVGRLDADTTGLLLFSRDGTLTQRLLHPRRAVPRTYLAEVEGLPDEALVAALTAGVETAAGTFTAQVARIEGALVELTVTEGKHRMVRRMLNNAGFPVAHLQRLRYGAVELADLGVGEAAPVEGEAAAWAVSLTG